MSEQQSTLLDKAQDAASVLAAKVADTLTLATTPDTAVPATSESGM
jgi:hypothetical protein